MVLVEILMVAWKIQKNEIANPAIHQLDQRAKVVSDDVDVSWHVLYCEQWGQYYGGV